MNKEEILEKSQQDYQKHDPFNESTKQKALSLSSLVMALAAGILFLIHCFIEKKPDLGLWGIVTAGCCVESLIHGTSKKKTGFIIMGIMWLLLTTVLFTSDIFLIWSDTH
jgi:cell division protein FtsW (lipid II flippase)